MADQSWARKPRAMSLETARQAARRIAEHAAEHHLSDVEIILHGGEPLLCGAAALNDIIQCVRAALPHETTASVRLQTNGTLLNPDILDTLLRNDVRVGVSFDGTRATHDARRIHANGRGSHSEVVSALGLLRNEPYVPIFSGILCTIDVAADPVATYESLIGFSPPRIDFLLPHANWSSPPPGIGTERYGQWLATAFDRWYASRPKETRVRLFEEIIHLLLGGQRSSSEAIGLSPVALIVVDTDGSLEQVDTLKSAFPGAPEMNMNVFANTFSDALAHPSILARQIGLAALPDDCRNCPVHNVCGGGYFPHRYRAGGGFRNPSVYSADLRYLIMHIGRRIHQDLLQHAYQ